MCGTVWCLHQPGQVLFVCDILLSSCLCVHHPSFLLAVSCDAQGARAFDFFSISAVLTGVEVSTSACCLFRFLHSTTARCFLGYGRMSAGDTGVAEVPWTSPTVSAGSLVDEHGCSCSCSGDGSSV